MLEKQNLVALKDKEIERLQEKLAKYEKIGQKAEEIVQMMDTVSAGTSQQQSEAVGKFLKLFFISMPMYLSKLLPSISSF